jgi:cytoskeletal protein CcmA (bactofilin family)
MALNSAFSKYFSGTDKSPSKTGKHASVTYIGSDAVLKGDTLLQSAALVAGTVLGTLSSNDHIKIELGGVVEGEVHCKELKVSGTVRGKLHCEKLIIVSSGLVEGEVFCNQMEIYDGGQFIGSRSAMIKSQKAPMAAHSEADNMTQALEKAVKPLSRDIKKTTLTPVAELAS